MPKAHLLGPLLPAPEEERCAEEKGGSNREYASASLVFVVRRGQKDEDRGHQHHKRAQKRYPDRVTETG